MKIVPAPPFWRRYRPTWSTELVPGQWGSYTGTDILSLHTAFRWCRKTQQVWEKIEHLTRIRPAGARKQVPISESRAKQLYEHTQSHKSHIVVTSVRVQPWWDLHVPGRSLKIRIVKQKEQRCERNKGQKHRTAPGGTFNEYWNCLRLFSTSLSTSLQEGGGGRLH